MPSENSSKDKKSKKPKKGFLQAFFTREEPDEDYIPELKAQWHTMNKNERVKFLIGALAGLMILLVGMSLIYIFISSLIN